MTRARDVANIDGVLTTTGDTYYASAAATPARLGIGTTGQVLSVSGGLPTWATPSAGANWTLLNAGGTTLSGSSTSITGISGADKIMVILSGGTNNTGGRDVYLRFNSDTGANYNNFGYQIESASTYNGANNTGRNELGSTYVGISSFSSDTGSAMSGSLLLSGRNTTNHKMFQCAFGPTPNGGFNHYLKSLGGWYAGSSTISSVQVAVQSPGSWTGGKIYVYTSA